ncbi:hypothetical protein ACFLT7_03550 [candidate division KSB1 bacterium]
MGKYISVILLIMAVVPSQADITLKGVEFQRATLHREGQRGDNWCITWGADGHQYAAMCDGTGWDPANIFYRTRTYRIKDGANNFSVDLLPNFPLSVDKTPWFGYGISSIDGVIYHFISQTPRDRWSGPFLGVKLIYSPDSGHTWFRHDGQNVSGAKLSPKAKTMFFWKEDARKVHGKNAFAFSTISFAQMGQDNGKAIDDYVYLYSPDGPYTHHLNMARVPRDMVTKRDAYEFFEVLKPDGSAQWSKNIRERGVVHTFPQKTGDDYFGWYSWLPSVVWNEGLGLFIMVTGGTYAGHKLDTSDFYNSWMHTKTGSLGFYYAKKTWGPWREFYYEPYWIVDNPGNRTYQPKLSPKWISPDGKEMVLIWSDAMKNAEGRSHSVNYKWNHMKIQLR